LLSARTVVHCLFAGGERAIGATVYGTVLALAALAAGAAEHQGPRVLVVLVAVTATVIWIAHVYANGLGESIERGHRLSWWELSAVASREVPILLAAAAPTAALLLGAVGVVQPATAIWIAFGVGLAALAVQGGRYARVEHFGPLATAAAVGANLALGGVVVALKVLISH
jgi:hypothetical protein